VTDQALADERARRETTVITSGAHTVLYDAALREHVDASWFDPAHWHGARGVERETSGRGAVLIVPHGDETWVVRHYRRGGYVQRFIEATDGLEVYTGRKGSPNVNFNLATGEALFVTMSTTTPYIVVGSDDPAVTYALNAPQVGVSKSGTNFYAYNYHQTAGTSKALMDDIGFTSTGNVQRYIEATNGLEVYTGRKGSPNVDFPLVPGEGYFVVMSSTVNYAPSHY